MKKEQKIRILKTQNTIIGTILYALQNQLMENCEKLDKLERKHEQILKIKSDIAIPKSEKLLTIKAKIKKKRKSKKSQSQNPSGVA